jgi:drug/metabolite transporter (DMT)-like permease
MTAIGAWLYLGEGLGLAGSGGVALLIGGVFWMAVEGVRRGGVDRAALIAALANSAVIALYSLIDGAGARLSGHAFAYNAWADALTAILFAPLILRLRGRAFASVVIRQWRRGLAGGAAAFFAYAIVVWAMTQAPIGLVAALRETSVIFAAATPPPLSSRRASLFCVLAESRQRSVARRPTRRRVLALLRDRISSLPNYEFRD